MQTPPCMSKQDQLPPNIPGSKEQVAASVGRHSNMASHSLHAFRNEVISRLERFCDGPWWLARSAAFCVLLSLFLAFPNLKCDYHGARADATVAKIRDLDKFWRTLTPQSPEHARVVAYRITVPLIARALGVELRGCYVLHALSGVILILAMLALSFQISGDKVVATLLTAAGSSGYAVSGSFLEERANFDGIALMRKNIFPKRFSCRI